MHEGLQRPLGDHDHRQLGLRSGPSNALRSTLNTPRPGRQDALIDAIRGTDKVTTIGMQMYKLVGNGEVVFEDLRWEEPLSESGNKFAGRWVKKGINR
jgi:hypothetical protein